MALNVSRQPSFPAMGVVAWILASALKAKDNPASMELFSKVLLTEISCLDRAFSLCLRNALKFVNNWSASSKVMDCNNSPFGFEHLIYFDAWSTIPVRLCWVSRRNLLQNGFCGLYLSVNSNFWLILVSHTFFVESIIFNLFRKYLPYSMHSPELIL